MDLSASSNGPDGAQVPPMNGLQDLSQLTQALNAIHDPRSTNQVRKDATVFLEQAKSSPAAPSVGFELASNKSLDHLARHYGLSLLEYTIRYRWESLEQDASVALIRWTVQLADGVSGTDPAFLRNKVAQIWLELAKRSWLDEWTEMDKELVMLWDKSYAHQTLVLQVLELLSEDAFDNDDLSSYVKGGGELRRACIETITSSAILAAEFPDRNLVNSGVRHGDEGWFLRLLDRLRLCLENYSATSPDVRTCTVAILQTLRSMMPWMVLKALHRTGCVEYLCRAIQIEDDQVQLAAVEVLHSIYHRANFAEDDVTELVSPLMGSEGLALLRNLLASSQADIDDLDDTKYLLGKKLTEVLCALGCFIEQRQQLMAQVANIEGFLDLYVLILRHDSLVISIPIIYLWTTLLNCNQPDISAAIDSRIAVLLEISSQRLLRYESLPVDSENLTFRFLNEDFDTMPERHAFVGNYRRFCGDIVERIVRRSPFEAMRHILAQADQLFGSLPGTDQPMAHDTYNSNAFPILRVDSQCTVISNAVRGYMHWMHRQRAAGASEDERHAELQRDIGQWCSGLLGRDFEDPNIHKRILQLISELNSSLFKHDSSMALAICDHILNKASKRPSDSTAYGDAIKDLQSSLPRVLQKLAIKNADAFYNVYAALEQTVESTINSCNLESRTNMEYRAFLLIIIHRSSLVPSEERNARLIGMVEPILRAWQTDVLTKGAESFEGFCELLGLDQFPSYFLANEAQSLEDWSSRRLDDSGLAIRDRISERSESLPLQPIKCLLMASTDRVPPESVHFDTAQTLWESVIPIILPTLLKLLSHAHAFGNPDKWSRFPPAMQTIIQRTLVDRVWQSGISIESRDDFFMRVRESKSTLEGLASATRAAVRGVRELSYWILHCLCQFGESFFRHADLAEPLASALYDDAHTLSSHQVSTLLRISNALLDACPPRYQDNFLPPLLIRLFGQVDRKLTEEWSRLDARSSAAAAIASGDALDQEMKAESILRQLTHSSVGLAATLLNPHGQHTAPSKRYLALAHPGVMSALLLFATHVLRMRDTRSLTLNIRALRAIIPEFDAKAIATQAAQPPSPPVKVESGDILPLPSHPRIDPSAAAEIREYLGRDALQAAITSLNEAYFADVQKDLASLIATLFAYVAPSSSAPRDVLLSLPGMIPARVDDALAAVQAARSERAMRAEVLRLLEGVRGVSIHEMGRVRERGSGVGVAGAGGPSSVEAVRAGGSLKGRPRTRMQEQFMSVDGGDAAGNGAAGGPDGGPARIQRGGSAEVEGMGALFG